MFVNASKDANMDNLRIDVVKFASGKSLTGKKKVVILDEADGITGKVQDALRGVMEDDKIMKNCRFILTANYSSKIIEALQSRCSSIVFQYTKEDRIEVGTQFISRIKNILEVENIKYDMHIVMEIIKKFMPDFRRILNELELLSTTGTIPDNALATLGLGYIGDICENLKDSEFTKLMEWAFANTHIKFTDMKVPLRNELNKNYLQPMGKIMLIDILAETDRAIALSGTDTGIQVAKMFKDIMADCDFK
jgi:replication factor C small subunit